MNWLAFAACIVISFTFSGIESGVLSVNRVRLRHFALQGEQAAIKLDQLLLRIERLMITVLLITNSANVLAVFLLYNQFKAWFGPWGPVLTLAVALPVAVVLLEFLPKAIFQRFPYRTLVIFARILTVAHWFLGPLVEIGAWFTRPLFRSSRGSRPPPIAAIDDIKRVLNEGVASGRVRPAQRGLILNIVDFHTVKAADVMLAMADIHTVEPETPITDMLRHARDTGYDHFPVVGPGGEIQGLIRVFDLLIEGVASGRAQSYMRRVVTVSPAERAADVLRKLRAARMNLAVVAPPHQPPAGVLFKEHLIHRLLAGKGEG